MDNTKGRTQDGILYPDGVAMPDMGSLVCVRVNKTPYTLEELREYSGNASDAPKLPHYDNLADGSSFFASDTGEFWLYNKGTDTWKKV